jgi:hypothetical protein
MYDNITLYRCLKIREFRIQSVDHFSVQIWKLKKCFLQIQAEKFSVYCYSWCRTVDDCGK